MSYNKCRCGRQKKSVNARCISCRLERPALKQSDDPSVRLIQLSKGKYTLVDASDFAWLSQWRWYAQPRCQKGLFYAAKKGKDGLVYMHRLITEAPSGLDVDHINHDSLDNRRSNIRVVTRSINLLNRRPVLS